jgi:hypothetical protein
MRIELQRVGMSRVSENNIPLVARILTPTGYGANLIPRDQFTDVDYARAVIQDRLNEKFGRAVEIRWIDATRPVEEQ